MEKLVVIAVSSCWVRRFNGIQLSGTSATHWYLQVADTVPFLNIDHQHYKDLELLKNRNRFPLAVLFEIDPGELDAAISAASHAHIEKQQPEAGKKATELRVEEMIKELENTTRTETLSWIHLMRSNTKNLQQIMTFSIRI
nr:hypothetical protein [Tanacetum cinerariifolium]